MSPSPRPSRLPSGYAPLLADLKTRVRSAQLRAALSVNREMIRLYWDVGRSIVAARRQERWGAGVVEQLSRDLVAEFPEVRGFSVTNLKYMAAFAEAWPATPIGQQPVGQLPWGHNILLQKKLRESGLREWYARKALDHGWSRSILELQIETRLHEREGKALTNFSRTLPPGQSDLAQSLLKDPYTFEFLTIEEPAKERTLELGLMDHVQKLLLEIGKGFAFVGRQVPFQVGEREFRVDLLFYNFLLRCFLVVDLKARAFEPEFAGKLNFYLSAVDAQMRQKDDAPTIGLLLTRGRDRLVVEYALRNLSSPMGVAEWTTTAPARLPEKLRGALPTTEQFNSVRGEG